MNRIKMSTALIFLCIISLVIVPMTAEANPTTLKVKLEKPKQSKIFRVGPRIPDTNTNWIPQGLTYLNSKDWLLISYYKGKEGEDITTDSRIMAVDRNNKKLVRVAKLLDENGRPHNGHVGGITVSGKYLWVASTTKVNEEKKNYLLRYELEPLVRDGIQTIHLRPKDIFSMDHKVSYVTYRVKRVPSSISVPQLCIGEHEDKGNGKLHCYNLDSNENMSSKDFSSDTPSHVQGVEFVGPDEGKLIILYSRSFGRKKNSKLDVYRGVGLVNPVKSLTLYSMSQGIVKVDNQLYVNYESGAKKYRSKDPIKITTHLYFGDIYKIITK